MKCQTVYALYEMITTCCGHGEYRPIPFFYSKAPLFPTHSWAKAYVMANEEGELKGKTIEIHPLRLLLEV